MDTTRIITEYLPRLRYDEYEFNSDHLWVTWYVDARPFCLRLQHRITGDTGNFLQPVFIYGEDDVAAWVNNEQLVTNHARDQVARRREALETTRFGRRHVYNLIAPYSRAAEQIGHPQIVSIVHLWRQDLEASGLQDALERLPVLLDEPWSFVKETWMQKAPIQDIIRGIEHWPPDAEREPWGGPVTDYQ